MNDKKNKGNLEVVCGSMFSGKSEELIRRLKRAEIARLNVIAFKPLIDTRNSIEYLTSHNGAKIKAFAIDQPRKLLQYIDDSINVIGIDEVQFFSTEVIGVVNELIERGFQVIAAGLDLDFRGVPFGCIPGLLTIADKITKLTAICIKCGQEAHYTQRLVDGNPAKAHDPLILIGAEECYQARCRNCFVIDQKIQWHQKQA